MMKKVKRGKRNARLAKRLGAYSVSAGAALTVGTNADGAVSYSGVQNMENGPGRFSVDMNGDGNPDVGFSMYSTATNFPGMFSINNIRVDLTS